jgi:short-subunit dehydrogenase
MTLKPIDEQVVVITGASSGIGLATARKMAAKGARLVLAARSEGALRQLVDEIVTQQGEAVFAVADVGNQEDVARIARTAVESFGGFDTWINNAGVSIFGKIEDTPVEDLRKLFETDFWGVVYGSLEAVKHLRERGGALINLGSVVSERVSFLQGMYSAAKFAVKGFTDSLRLEVEHDEAPISVTLVQPSATDTPFTLNAKNYTGREFRLPPPVYTPDTVANAILAVAQNPRREIVVGGGGKMLSKSEQFAPRLTDKIMESKAFDELQKKDAPASPLANALDRPSERLAERGNYDGHVIGSSLYTSAVLHPVASTLAFFSLGLGLAALWTSVQREAEKDDFFTPEEERQLLASY